jgi:hypothetical protein
MKGELKNRSGFFEVDARALESAEELIEITNQVAVTRCEYLFHSNKFAYDGYSALFDVVEEGYKSNVYNVVKDGNGYRFERADKQCNKQT